jgi:GT2 family glycosyltransferase
MKPKTNVVIICYGAYDYTKATIGSLFEKTNTSFNLTVIDNGSDFQTREFLEYLQLPANCHKYKVVHNTRNMGVGYAYNQGFLASIEDGIKYTCFCNNDLYFSRGWLEILEDCLDKNPNVAMVNPLRPSTRTHYDDRMSTMSRLMQVEETLDYKKELEDFMRVPIAEFDGFCKGIVSRNRGTSGSNIEFLKFPDSLSTCVCLANNNHIKQLGYFADPIFKKYGSEDVDTSWRVMRLGYDCAISKDVYIHHFRGKSLQSTRLNRKELLKVSNRLLYTRWRREISIFLKEQLSRGVDVAHNLTAGTDEYWLLSQLNSDVDLLGAMQSWGRHERETVSIKA